MAKKPKFYLHDFDSDDYVMHCDRPEKAKRFLDVLINDGRKWLSGSSYKDSKWCVFGVETCYDFNNGQHCYTKYYKNEKDYVILEYDDFDWGYNECKFMNKCEH